MANDNKRLPFFFSQSIRTRASAIFFSISNGAEKIAEELASASIDALVLSCNAGMGKSTNLRRVEEILQEKCSSYLTARIDLRTLNALGEWTGKTAIDAVTLIQAEVSKGAATVSLQELTAKIAARQAILLLDSFDEVSPLHRERALKLLQLLREAGFKMLVATRPHDEEAVTHALGTRKEDIYELLLIERDDRPTFLAGIWNDLSNEQVIDTARKLMQDLTSRYPDIVLWGVPLNLYFIALAFPAGILTQGYLDHQDIFKFFINQNIDYVLRKKFEISENDSISGPVFDEERNRCFVLLKNLAFNQILKNHLCHLSEEDNEYIVLFPLLNGNRAECDCVTFAEYLVAVQVVETLKNSDKQNVFLDERACRSFLANVEYKKIRMFVDGMDLSNVCTQVVRNVFTEIVAYTCIEGCYLNTFRMFQENGALDVDFFNRGIINTCGVMKFPLEIALTGGRCDVVFVEYLLENNCRLDTFVNIYNFYDIFKCAMQMKLNRLVMENWDTFQEAVPAADLRVPLQLAFEFRNAEIVRCLIEKGCELEADNDFQSALSLALECLDAPGKEEIVKILLSRNVQVTANNFTTAAESGSVACLKMMVSHIETIEAKDGTGRTALMAASQRKNADCLNFLLDVKADSNAADDEGRKPLDYALREDAVECFKVLMHLLPTEKRDLNKMLFRVLESGAMEIFSMLVSEGADPAVADNAGNTCLHLVAQSQSSRKLKHIISNFLSQLNINGPNAEGRTPLHLAVMSKDTYYDNSRCLLEMVEVALEAKDNDGWTPLHHAVSGAVRLKKVALLLEKGAQVNSRSNDERTPLMLAARSWNDDVLTLIDLLIEKGADPTLVDAEGKNCLHHAVEGGNAISVGMFCALVSIDSRCKGGLTPLMLAAKKIGGLDAFPLLLRKGADSTLQDEDGKNCLHHAAENAYDNVISLLAERGLLEALNCDTKLQEKAEQLAQKQGHDDTIRKLHEKLKNGQN